MRLDRMLMTGVVAAAAVAGSAGAEIVTGPSASSTCITFNPSTPTTAEWFGYTDGAWGSALQSFSIAFVCNAPGSPGVARTLTNGVTNIQYSLNNGQSWLAYASTQSATGSLSDELSYTWGATVQPNVLVGVGNFRIRATIEASASILSGDTFTVLLDWSSLSGGGVNSRQSTAVPAPGAFALLGAASLAGKRRRR